MGDATGPLSWRDVYKAVELSEKRIIDAVNSAVAPLSEANKDHEQRIRSLEHDGCLPGKEALRVALALGVKYDVVDDQLNAFTNRERGIFQTLSSAQKVTLLIFGLLGALAVFMDITSKYFGGS